MKQNVRPVPLLAKKKTEGESDPRDSEVLRENRRFVVSLIYISRRLFASICELYHTLFHL